MKSLHQHEQRLIGYTEQLNFKLLRYSELLNRALSAQGDTADGGD